MLLATAWFVWNVNVEPIADFSVFKPYMMAGFTAVGILACIFVQDFLAVRGLAVLMLLLAKLMLDTGRPHLGGFALCVGHSNLGLRARRRWHLVRITPWKLRDILSWATATEKRIRIGSRDPTGICGVRAASRPDGVSRDVTQSNPKSWSFAAEPSAISFSRCRPSPPCDASFRTAHLEVLGYPHIAQLAVAGGLVDRVQPIEARGLAGFFARGGTLEPGLMDYFSGFDLVISYLYDPDEIFKTNVCRCPVGQFIVGPHRPDETERIHATRVFLEPLERLAIFDADPVPRLKAGRLPPCPASAPARAKQKFKITSASQTRTDETPALLGASSRQRQRKEKLAGNQMGRVDSTNHGDDQLEPAAGWWRGGRRTPATTGWRHAVGALFHCPGPAAGRTGATNPIRHGFCGSRFRHHAPGGGGGIAVRCPVGGHAGGGLAATGRTIGGFEGNHRRAGHQRGKSDERIAQAERVNLNAERKFGSSGSAGVSPASCCFRIPIGRRDAGAPRIRGYGIQPAACASLTSR